VVALKRRHPYDVPLLHDHPDRVAEDSVLMETRSSHLMERARPGVPRPKDTHTRNGLGPPER